MINDMATVTRTVRLKVKREAYPWLNAASSEVNLVWNYCNETSYLAGTRTDSSQKWLTGFDLCALTAGASELFDHIRSATIQRVCSEYAMRRRKAKKAKIKWRASKGTRRSLGWIPLKSVCLKRHGNSIRYASKTFRVFESARLPESKLRDGCFAQDSLGDWWLCLPVDQGIAESVAPKEAVGIDLGLKAIATTSDGDTLGAGRWTQSSADKLAKAQRRGHKQQAKRIHRKLSRQRKDALHKFSTRIVSQYQKIVVGDVSSLKLVKTRMAKSVLDSGWGMLRNFLEYKSQQAARSFEVVDERYTSRACSNCGSLSGPRGVNGLRVREWTCGCGVTHDRDVNAAKNILRSGCAPPFAGTSRVARFGAAA